MATYYAKPIEALADAIMCFEGFPKPGSRANRNRNPGNIRPLGDQAGDEGYRVFTSLLEGYQALLDDLQAKVDGHNSHGLGIQSTLLQLLNVYAPAGDNNNPTTYAKYVVWYINEALGRTDVKLSSTLGELFP